MPSIYVNDQGTVKKVGTLHVNDAGTVKAVKEAWTNDAGTVKQVYASSGVPSAPGNLRVVTSGATAIDLAWDAAAPNGFTVTGYDVYMAASENGSYTLRQSFGNVLTGAITGLASATNYWFKCLAKNSAGSSAFSNVAAGTTTIGVPAAPSLSYASNSATTITVSISRGGGAVPSSYRVHWIRAGTSGTYDSQTAVYSGSPQNVTLNIGVANTAYAMYAVAIGAGGESAPSNDAYGATAGANGTNTLGVGDTLTGGGFSDIGFARNSAEFNGGTGTAAGSYSGPLAGYTVESFLQVGVGSCVLVLAGANIPSSAFQSITVGSGPSSTNLRTLKSSEASFEQNVGASGNFSRWSWNTQGGWQLAPVGSSQQVAFS